MATEVSHDYAADVLNYWFPDDGFQKWWFESTPEIDEQIRERFGRLLDAVEDNTTELPQTLEGKLAEILLLDQFSRTIYRGTKDCFKNDSRALKLSREVKADDGFDALPTMKKVFALMSFMHAEDLNVQNESMEVFGSVMPAGSPVMQHAAEHRDMIVKFGRFPHRNALLGRESTAEELEHLKSARSYNQAPAK